jgi:Flp pilus assembly protein TadD
MKFIYQAGMGRWLAIGLATLAQSTHAQPAPKTTIEPAVPSTDPADRLAANLVILSHNPRDVGALTEAGLSAIAVGDGDAALSFLARAEEISPRNGQIKVAIGSALLLKQKPTDALRLFSEAVDLGVSEQAIARDRGLAHDLRGDPRRAQHDYGIALRAGPDDELTIRYALSLGISGDDEKAQQLLDPLLRQKNPAAWRARAFVLAMNGDPGGAEAVANTVMPGGAGASMSPFLRRLATLNAAERALAVNFGIMPSDGQLYAMADTGGSYRPSGAGGASDGLIPAGDPLGPRPEDTESQQRPSAPVSKEPRRRPGRESATLTAGRDDSAEAPASPAAVPARPAETASLPDRSMSARVGGRIGPVDPARLPAEVRAILEPDATRPAGEGLPSIVVTSATSLPPPSAAAAPPPSISPPAAMEAPPAARFEIAAPPPITAPVAEAAVVVAKLSAHVAQPASATGLGAILADLEIEQESVAGPLPSAAGLKAARIAAQRKAAVDAKAAADAKAAKEAKEAERLAAARHPARIWVQVATGSNEAGLPGTWKKLKDKAPAVFKGQNASSVPFKATNRLLVGPFKSQSEARVLVNAMNKAGLQGSTFSSDAGQVIAKVSSR